MARRLAAGDMEKSEVLLLLEEYCSQQRSKHRSKHRAFDYIETDHLSRETRFRSGRGEIVFQCALGGQKDESSDTNRTAVADRLAQIAESAPISEVDVKDQDEIIQKLVELMTTFGDDIDKKIKQNPSLQQQLCKMNYDMFEKLTSSVQNQAVVAAGTAAAAAETASDRRIQQQRIALAFEVTSRLSAMDFIPKRRVLSFGDQYIQQHHNAWLQQHGGWDEVFDAENVD